MRWHYQWIVLNDFLPLLVDAAVLQDVRQNGRKYFNFDKEPYDGKPFMPLEFSGAAYRLGHSMIRENYNYNRVFGDLPATPNRLAPATLGFLFRFTGGGAERADPGQLGVRLHPLLRLRRRPGQPRPALRHAAHPRAARPAGAELLRARSARWPSATSCAAAGSGCRRRRTSPRRRASIRCPPADLVGGAEGAVVSQHGFDKKSPLWWYILKEAEVQTGGATLGQLGSRIVAEVFVGILEADPHGFLKLEPTWKPSLPSEHPNDFKMTDLLRFVGEINPLGP